VCPLSAVLLTLVSAISPPVLVVPAAPPGGHGGTALFPATVAGTSPSGARITYRLAGLVPEEPCRRAFRPPVPPRCLKALRATYADGTRTFVVTAGIAVLGRRGAHPPAGGPPGERGRRARPGRSGPQPRPPGDPAARVRPAAFPGGPAERFSEDQCFTEHAVAVRGRYVVATAAGYADGRPYRPGDRVSRRLVDAARDVAKAVRRSLPR
jgi:hypothetical protein